MGERDTGKTSARRTRRRHVALNTGGGVKCHCSVHCKARLDYRVFKLRGTPLYSTVHRFYAGVNLAF
jgi:hypothetical protein